jgi:hypothetical protein
VAFSILHQVSEGALWRRLTAPDGTPRTVPLGVTRAVLEQTVGQVPGSYQLLPLDRVGRLAGDPPQMIAVPAPPSCDGIAQIAAAAPTAPSASPRFTAILRTAHTAHAPDVTAAPPDTETSNRGDRRGA